MTSSSTAKTESAVVELAERNPRSHSRIRDVGLLLAADQPQRGVVAGGVADGEQLLGVGAVAAAAHLLRDGEVEIELAVGGAAVTVTSFAGGQGLGGVEGLHAVSFP